jgi:hypothetical protein
VEGKQGNAGLVVAMRALGGIDAAVFLDIAFEVLEPLGNHWIVDLRPIAEGRCEHQSRDAYGIGFRPAAVIGLHCFQEIERRRADLLERGGIVGTADGADDRDRQSSHQRAEEQNSRIASSCVHAPP